MSLEALQKDLADKIGLTLEEVKRNYPKNMNSWDVGGGLSRVENCKMSASKIRRIHQDLKSEHLGI